MIGCLNPTVQIRKLKSVDSEISLRGRRIVFFNNNKPNGNILFDYLAENSSSDLEVESVSRLKKASPAHKATKEILEQLLETAEIVVNGVGD